ncbi:MAG: 30S ribosomal protein S2 [Phycisphaerales bacterium]|nr:MAG: 30S ribosomal protein S2 [Phycisphaerales bacterium]
MASELARELVDAGIHFGHRVSRWNPKMEPYIFGRRNLIHVIDIRETVKGLIRAKKFIARVVADNGDVLFVGTKRQARHAVEAYAKEAGMPYVVERWLGGTLTNFETIRSRLARLEELEREEADGTLQQYGKKRIARDNRERRKIKRNLEGVRNMTRLPKALVVIDVHREHIAVKEAKKLGIATVCLIDTDSDPDYADIPIPGNDDSMRSIEVVLKHMAAAVEAGKRGRTESDAAAAEAARKRRSRRPTTARAKDEPAEKELAVTATDPPAQDSAKDQNRDDPSSSNEVVSEKSS